MSANHGELWSFMRSTLSQGGDIWLDHRERSHEEYAIRLDTAAIERVARLEKLLAGEDPTDGSSAVQS